MFTNNTYIDNGSTFIRSCNRNHPCGKSLCGGIGGTKRYGDSSSTYTGHWFTGIPCPSAW